MDKENYYLKKNKLREKKRETNYGDDYDLLKSIDSTFFFKINV